MKRKQRPLEERRKYTTSAKGIATRLAYARKFRGPDNLGVLDNTLRFRYGITVDDFFELLERQGGVCAVCGGVEKARSRLSVDHCHDTGVVRGLLCTNCNVGIGRLKDDPDLLRKAVAYLERTCV